MPAPAPRHHAPAWLLAAATFLLFSVWAGSFIAIEALLIGPAGPGRFDWLGLTAARFAPVMAFCGLFCALFHRRECAAVIRAHWRRLVLCGLLAVPGYNFALYYGQQHRIAAPIASLLTTLAPLFLLVLAAVFLGERITARRAAGFVLAATGVALVARARTGPEGAAYPLLVAVTALAPLCWSVYTTLSKPVLATVPPLLWTYLAICAGTIPMLFVLPFSGGPGLLTLDLTGALWLAHLSLLCTVLGFALWSWLLRHLPASTTGFTIFLNPPLTTAYKWLLAALCPAAFAFSVSALEGLGGLLTLAGVAVAIRPAAPRVSR